MLHVSNCNMPVNAVWDSKYWAYIARNVQAIYPWIKAVTINDGLKYNYFCDEFRLFGWKREERVEGRATESRVEVKGEWGDQIACLPPAECAWEVILVGRALWRLPHTLTKITPPLSSITCLSHYLLAHLSIFSRQLKFPYILSLISLFIFLIETCTQAKTSSMLPVR